MATKRKPACVCTLHGPSGCRRRATPGYVCALCVDSGCTPYADRARAVSPRSKAQPAAPVKCAKCLIAIQGPPSDSFCSGCQHHVCGVCGEAPWGRHTLADHTQPCRVCGERVEVEGEELCAGCA